ncbi:uncharacterized protein LOC141654945 [Silene latifolia]|uniref:uncharacterized protein LOC141654945 n=1 Tax=Silene latifolia TaxID=37657 RepID=UPI003D783495
MSSSEKFVQPSIPKFDGHYDFWSMTMENFLRSKEMWSLVEEGIPAASVGTSPASEAQRKLVEEAKLKDLKVKNYLFQSIDREILETILDKKTSKSIWESMKQKYQGSTKVKRAQLQALRKEFELLAMKQGEKVDVFLGRTLAVVNKMRSNGETMEQSTLVSKVLRSLTSKFDYVVCSIEESNDLSTLSIDELHGSLLVHEQRMQGSQEEEHVLKVVHDDRTTRGRGRGMNRGGRGRGRGRQPVNKSLIECYYCHNLGHFQYECPNWDKKANYVEEEEELLLMAYEVPHQKKQEEVWFLDSGCSNHMTGNKEWFYDMEENFSRTVKLGNDTKMAVVAKRKHKNENKWLNSDQKRSKLDDKSKKCVFLGVSDESKAWRLYEPISKKVIISKDVVFEEDKTWDWGRTEEEINQDILEWEDEDEINEEVAHEFQSNNSSNSDSAVKQLGSAVT